MFGRLIREPLVQFLLVGIALFGGWRLVTPAEARRDDANRIVITEDDLTQMRAAWLAKGLPPPTPQQLQGLIEERVHEEVLYREALALGMDKDDVIVRRQLARKMEFVAEDLSKLDEPTPQELRTWFDQHASQFALPARVTFRHVYFSPDRRGANARADAELALPRLAGQPIGVSTAIGDPFMFQDYYGDRSIDVLAKEFGPGFANALVATPTGAWAGPVESGYGWHLVYIDTMTPQRVPDFEEIEPEVKNAWIEDHREQTRARLYKAMRARYEVVVPAT